MGPLDRLQAMKARADPEGHFPSVFAAAGAALICQQSDQHRRWLAASACADSATAAGHRAAREFPADAVSAATA